MSKTPYLSVVIPAYKEMDNLGRNVLEDVYKYLSKQKYSWEVLVVNDGSPDQTAQEVEKRINKLPGFTLLNEPHRGKGGTVITGLLKSKGEVLLFTDMDQATPIKELDKVLPKFTGGFDIVIGSRAGRPGEPLLRQLMAYGFSILRFIVLGLPYKDTQCGFKALTNDAAQKVCKRMKLFSVDSRSTGVTAGFDLELLYVARKLNLKVSEVPVSWTHVGSIRVSPLKDSWLGFKAMMQVRINALSGLYETNKK